MKASSVFRRLDTRTMGPAQRLAFGAACGIVTVLGMWLISTLQHAQNYGLGLKWQEAVVIVLVMSIATLASGWWGRQR